METPLTSSTHDAAMVSWIQKVAPYGVITTDTCLVVRNWNQWMETNSGMALGEVSGRGLFEIFPEIRERFSGRFDRALEGEVSVLSTVLHQYLIPLPPAFKGSGFERMQQTARIGPLLEGDRVVGTIIVIEDVTQREFQTGSLRQQHERDQVLSWALAHLIKAKEPLRMVRELFFKIAEFFDFDGYVLYLGNWSDGFRLQAAGGLMADEEAQFAALDGARSFPRAIREKETVVVSRQQHTTDDCAVPVVEMGIRSYAVLPLVLDSNFEGVLCVLSRSRDEIGQNESDILTTIAQYLSISVHRERIDRELQEAQVKLHEHARNLEVQVAERTANLLETIAELETFSYSLAHDLRAPLRAISGYCDVLLEDFQQAIPKEAQSFLERLKRASGKLDILTRDLLQFSRVSREPIEVDNVDLDDVLTDVLSFVSPEMRLSVKVRRPLHSVLGHRRLVQSCFVNLLENAFKFVETGTAPEVEVWSEEVKSTAENGKEEALPFNAAQFRGSQPATASVKGADRIRVSIQDRGIGIPKAAQTKIFGIFERGAHTAEFEGTGIGLAVVARAIERMGGRCGVQSEEGQGSLFWLEFLPAS